MITGTWRMSVMAAWLIGGAGILPVAAELPQLSEKEWLGHFVGFQSKKLQFGVTAEGKATIRIMGKGGEPIARNLSVPVEFLVEEVMPDGKARELSILPETLQSAQPATDKPRQIVIQGKVKGDAGFEIFIDEKSGAILLGGRLLDRGTLTKNPLRFSVKVKIPNAYPYEKNGGDEKAARKLEEKLEDDRLQLTWMDGKRVKQAIHKPVDASSVEINGPGISSAQIEFSSYSEKKFEFTASENSLMTLSNVKDQPLYKGFSVIWTTDPAKDPDGKARLAIEVR